MHYYRKKAKQSNEKLENWKIKYSLGNTNKFYCIEYVYLFRVNNDSTSSTCQYVPSTEHETWY